MTNTVQGFVAKTFTKDFPRKDGSTATSYSCKLESAETGLELPKFYQYGFKPLPFKEGDFVELKVTPKNEKADEITGGRVIPADKAPQRKPKQAAASEGGFGGANDGPKKPWGGKGGGGGGYNNAARDAQFAEKEKYQREHVQPRIEYQSARNAAIEAVGVLLTHDGLPTSKAAGKAGSATRYEDIVEYINKLTVQFFHDTQTLRLVGTVADSGQAVPQPAHQAQLPEAEPAAVAAEDDVIVEDSDDGAF